MVEASKSSFNILVIAEINGAKKFMYEDGLIGLAHYMRNLPDAEKPNLFVVNGGLLPEMPINRGGERNKDHLRVVVEGVNNVEGAAAVMKPHMERLMNALPEGAGFIYVMGKADEKNIDSIKLDLSNLYLDAISEIKKAGKERKEKKGADGEEVAEERQIKYIFEPKIMAAEVDIESRKTVVNSLRQAEAALLRRIAEAAEDANVTQFKEELKKVRTNLKLNREELGEFEARRDLLNILNQLTYSEAPRDRIGERINETNARIDATNKRLDLSVSGTPEYEDSLREAKLLGNRLRALTKRYNESADGETARDLMARQARIHKFTGNIPLPKNANDIVDLLAKSYYMTALKDALGRKREVTIQESSLQVYEKKMNGFEFNVVVADGLGGSNMYKVNSNAQFLKTAFILTRSLKEKKQLDGAQLNVFIRGRNVLSSFAMDTWTDQKNAVAVALSQGPFIDMERNTLAFLNKVKTDETRLAPRGVVDSSASMLKIFPDGSVVHETIKPQKLNDEKIRDDIEEAKALEKLISRLKEGAVKAVESTGAEDPSLSKAILNSKRPSEVKDKDLMHVGDEASLAALAPYAKSAMPQNAQTLSVVEFTDVHIGNYGNLELLRAAAKDALARKPNLLVLDGDNIEGNHSNYKYTARPENDFTIIDEFERWMKSKKLSSARIKDEKLALYEKLRNNVVSNIDNQPKMFVGAISELVLDVISRGGLVVVVSGNHYNKTHRDSQHDEASILASHIEMLLDGASDSGKIPKDWREKGQVKKGSGSDIAAETFKINGIDVEIRHGLAQDDARVAGAVTTKRSNAALVITGHLHSIREVNNINTMVVQGPTMQSTNTDPFVKTIQVPVSPVNVLTGYLHLELGVKDGEITEQVYEPRLRNQLSVKDELFTQFLRDRRTYETPKEKKVALKARA